MHYTKKDKDCSHCDGVIEPHAVGKYGEEQIKYWCNKCGSSNSKLPPIVGIKETS